MIDQPAWTWKLLRAGAFRLDGGSMFGVVPKALWSRLVQPDEHNRIPLQTNCLLLERGQKRVLIETGYGEKWTDKERAIFALEDRTIVDALADEDVSPESIDMVIVTHLHFDHAGALTKYDPENRDEAGNPQIVPTFPNATIIVQEREWLDALANKSTMTKTYLRTHLDPVREQVHVVNGEVEVLPGIRVAPAPGHTWGQQVVRFTDADGTLCFTADVMPTTSHAGLAFSMGYDMEPFTNMQTKRELLERACAGSWRLVLDHEPNHAVVRVKDDDNRLTLEPA